MELTNNFKEIKGLYMSDKANEDIISKPILPVLFENIMREIETKSLFLLELKVNPCGGSPEKLDAEQTELVQVYKNLENLNYEIVFNLFEYKENNSFLSHPYQK